MANNGVDLLIERLLAWGVGTVFSLPGDGINGLYEALRTRQDNIRLVQVRHEEATAFMAGGYAKFTGRLGVCLATSGCGGTHLLNGLYDAKYDGQPVLAITGHTYHDLSGTFYQQDVDLVRVFTDVAAYNERVMGPSHVENVLDEAIRTALGQRTVAHLSFPKGYQDWTLDDKARDPSNMAGYSAPTPMSPAGSAPAGPLQAAADLINAGQRVAILAGRGALGARAEVLQLAELVGGPVVKALLAERGTQDTIPTKPQVVPHTLSPLLAADASVTCDCGNNTTGAARHIQMQEHMLFSTSGLRATMGAGLPYAVAAALAYPGRQVEALAGDGGFTMLMGELATAVKYRLSIKVFIFHNNALGQIKWEQIAMDGTPEFGVDLQSIDFAQYAQACGATGFTLTETKDADRVIRAALAHDGPVVVDCHVGPNEPPMPPHVHHRAGHRLRQGPAMGRARHQRDCQNVFRDQYHEAVATKDRSLLSVVPGL
ncbi:thiamine pyrophosphate-binding protein [Hymenobacter sp. PAMC 26628]|uniref:thiamine pyrophosphate-binding protein n=1 Tax=Hymenobacter sp. PAMC 26628 TaxID=1484118 RepID=UPI0007701648|nr:thiamine pyrophosphate-dependent enzyme [Hymenobacter sp. PAMC 26628]AMJ67482.1 pyruvate oxidase [Hymenobacter sp. PAMC 26628]